MMDLFITAIYFFMTFYMLGFSLLHIARLRLPGDFFERNVFRLGAGLAIFPLLILLLHTIGLPLHWFVLLLVSSVVFIAHQVDYWILKGNMKKGGQDALSFQRMMSEFRPRWKHIYHVGACVLTLILFLVYLKGAFGYPYLEDDDSWFHAMGAKYVSITRSYHIDTALKEHVGGVSIYLWPYPPFYTSMMGILHQLNESVSWTLKFFNVLLISLGILFFYVFASLFLESHKHAFLAAMILVLLPSFMSHFIWAQTLAIVCFFPSILALHMVYAEGRFRLNWFITAIFLLGSTLIIQPWAAGIFGFFLGLYWLGQAIAERSLFKSKFVLLAIALACVVSLSFWGPSIFLGLGGQKYDVKISSDVFYTDDSSIGLKYGLGDFITAPKVSKMDQATGLGLFMFILVLFALFVLIANIRNMSSKMWFWAALLWFFFGVYNFYALQTDWFRLTPHRMWAFFSIPVAIIAAKGMLSFWQVFRKRIIVAFLLTIIVLAGIIWTSGYPKYVVQTSYWPPGMLFKTPEETQGYVSLSNLPPDTKVLPLCDAEKDRAVVGMDKLAEKWDYTLYDFRSGIMDKSPDKIVSFLRSKGYAYFILDSSCVSKYGLNKTNDFINTLTGVATVVGSNNGFILFKV